MKRLPKLFRERDPKGGKRGRIAKRRFPVGRERKQSDETKRRILELSRKTRRDIAKLISMARKKRRVRLNEGQERVIRNIVEHVGSFPSDTTFIAFLDEWGKYNNAHENRPHDIQRIYKPGRDFLSASFRAALGVLGRGKIHDAREILVSLSQIYAVGDVRFGRIPESLGETVSSMARTIALAHAVDGTLKFMGLSGKRSKHFDWEGPFSMLNGPVNALAVVGKPEDIIVIREMGYHVPGPAHGLVSDCTNAIKHILIRDGLQQTIGGVGFEKIQALGINIGGLTRRQLAEKLYPLFDALGFGGIISRTGGWSGEKGVFRESEVGLRDAEKSRELLSTGLDMKVSIATSWDYDNAFYGRSIDFLRSERIIKPADREARREGSYGEFKLTEKGKELVKLLITQILRMPPLPSPKPRLQG